MVFGVLLAGVDMKLGDKTNRQVLCYTPSTTFRVLSVPLVAVTFLLSSKYVSFYVAFNFGKSPGRNETWYA